MAITLSGTDGITSPSFVPSSTTAPIVGQYLPSANTIGFVTAGTERLRIDSSGNVGIGTSSPAGKLDIRGVSASSYLIDTTAGSAVSSAMYLGVPSVTTYAGLVTDYANDRLYIRHNSATRMTLDSSGNLGLGVTPSAWGSASRRAIQIGPAGAVDSGTQSQVVVSANRYFSGSSDLYINSAPASAYQQQGGVHSWYTAPSGTAGNAISFTQAMTLDASSYLKVFYPNNTAYYAQLDSRDGNSYLSAIGTSTALIFSANGSERARIDSSGVLSLTQGQLKFPATQSASSDANTLDDYEEGTWTPTLNYLGTLTYSTQVGSYTKIGNRVLLSFSIIVSSTDTTQDATSLTISGIPFSSSVSHTACASILTERMYSSYNTTSPTTFFALLNPASSSFLIMQNNFNGQVASASWYSSNPRSAYKGGTQYIHGTIHYITS